MSMALKGKGKLPEISASCTNQQHNQPNTPPEVTRHSLICE